MDKKPLMIDLYCGLGGWASGGIAEGYYVVGFDNERHQYGDAKYPAQLVLQDVLTLHGSQFKSAALIVASPPCQEYSYMAMPWTRAKAIAAEYRSGARDTKKLTALFDACFRIQAEAIEAAGHFIPLVVENVRGAIPWVGRSRWNFGSFHLWGDVPALMPMTAKRLKGGWLSQSDGSPMRRDDGHKVTMASWRHPDNPRHVPGQGFNTLADRATKNDGQKTIAHGNRRDGHSHTRHLTNQAESDGVKQSGISGPCENGKGDKWFQDGAAQHGSKSNARKAASAVIAKIPFPLAQHIARTWKP